MPTLTINLRNDLGRTIVQARQAAEAGARKALESLAVGQHEPHGSMSVEECNLRNRLRARGRQLGDIRDKQRGSQSIDRLAHEVAYEHWHRMLFGRYLAENNFLIHPEHKVAVSLDEVQELARETGQDPRDLADRFTQDSLPQIFRSSSPALEITLASEIRETLDKLLNGLPDIVFTANDSLVWTYQYWQAEKKDAINESGDKIGADELPAVTQLFTEPYMVLFLFHNTIGVWHADKVLAANPNLAETASSEEELRQAVRLQSQGGYDFEYLRFVRKRQEGDEKDNPTGPWHPAAGTFESWPKTAKELKVLDPCCGSGHFLIEGFDLLVRLRMDEEELDLKDAIRGVLADNLHGLELDPHCTQTGAFNLAMAAWKLAGKPVKLPAMPIACSGLAVGSSKSKWTQLADNDRLRAGMNRLYDLFEQAPELGSLIDPKALEDDLHTAYFSELQPLLKQALMRKSDDVENTERAATAQEMARAAVLLSDKYTLLITNVPYLGRRDQGENIRQHLGQWHPDAKTDLATAFLERMVGWIGSHGTAAAVTPQNWLFLSSWKRLRKKLLTQRTWNLVARLGEHSFQSSSAGGAFTAMVSISASQPRKDWDMCGVDVSAPRGEVPINAQNKATLLRGESLPESGGRPSLGLLQGIAQATQLGNPDCTIVLDQLANFPLLEEYAYCYQGAGLADIKHFRLMSWEVQEFGSIWTPLQSSPSGCNDFSGYHFIVRWERGMGELVNRSAMSGKNAWGKAGIAIAWLGRLPSSIYLGSPFDNSASVIVADDPAMTLPIWCYCKSVEFNRDVRKINQKTQVANATMVKVPFDRERWQKFAREQYPNGLPESQSDDPTQWLFHGHPVKAAPATILQVAVSRLLNYRWPPELDPKMHLADEARKWVTHCKALNTFADKDGIVCLSAMQGERSAVDRLRELLSTAFGSDWSTTRERELLAVAGNGKKPAASLDAWLRDKFFEEHCKLFHHRPFVWHIWDGHKNGFHCLVNAHKLTDTTPGSGEGRRTLETITYSYLGNWINRQKTDQAKSKEGANARLTAAQDLQSQLKKILKGEPPYDLFVRWKPLHKQALGWEPDINDGVRLNVRPFMKAKLRTGGKKGAGVLRWKPNIKWDKDRGKEPKSLRSKINFPWFWSCNDKSTDFTGGSNFDGNRWNNLHYTRTHKEAARNTAAKRETEEVKV